MGVEPLHTGIALVLLFAGAFAVMTVSGLTYRRELVISAVRAFVQLILVALVIAWIFTHPQGAVLYLGVMLVVAAYTSNRRIGGNSRDRLMVLLAIFLGAGATITIVAAPVYRAEPAALQRPDDRWRHDDRIARRSSPTRRRA
jgi:putative ABC transport system permease protein